MVSIHLDRLRLGSHIYIYIYIYSGVPSVEACDLVSYLVLQTSFITASQFKVRKGLEAYNQFVCGWVKDVHTMKSILLVVV